MKFDEEMEKAAKTIQSKYRKRPKNKKGGNQEPTREPEGVKKQEEQQPEGILFIWLFLIKKLIFYLIKMINFYKKNRKNWCAIRWRTGKSS